ncbi:MAG: globin [Pseudomonadales bacterium]|jgi:hemoglobin-like flavoprotein|nr:globin [Pseudomonadales bacterium]
MVLLNHCGNESSMNDLQRVNHSLEQLANIGVDITPAVYARFFAACPPAESLFGTAEARAVQGKMVNELVQTILDRLGEKPYSPVVVETMVSDHDSWGATLPMYDAFLAAFVDTLEETLGEEASPATMTVWRRELASLREQIAGNLA